MTSTSIRRRLLTLCSGAGQSAQSLRDDEVVREFVRTGQDDLFELLVGRHKESVFRLAASVLGPGREAEAEDLTQEVFLTVFSRLAGFRHEASFSTWLYRLTYNRAIDARRGARWTRPHVAEECLVEQPNRGRTADPWRTVATDQLRMRLLEALNSLGDPQRSVLFLHYWMDRPVDEIARLLDLRPGTVKSHLHRARRRLQPVLEELDRG